MRHVGIVSWPFRTPYFGIKSSSEEYSNTRLHGLFMHRRPGFPFLVWSILCQPSRLNCSALLAWGLPTSNKVDPNKYQQNKAQLTDPLFYPLSNIRHNLQVHITLIGKLQLQYNVLWRFPCSKRRFSPWPQLFHHPTRFHSFLRLVLSKGRALCVDCSVTLTVALDERWMSPGLIPVNPLQKQYICTKCIILRRCTQFSEQWRRNAGIG